MSKSHHEPREQHHGKVTISRKEYDVLLKKQEILDSLKANGVDNWEGYDVAMSEVSIAE